MVPSLAVLHSALGGMGSALWIGFAPLLLWNRRVVGSLAELPTAPPPGGWPSLAVVFAARNEAAMVEAATLSLLAQDYPGLEIIAIDDRSTDGTGPILDRLAATDPRLRVVHIDALPPGWLGKNHALQQGARATEAAWLLFTDGDVLFQPGVLRQSLGHVVRSGADHLVVAPEVLTDTFAERSFLALFAVLSAVFAPPWRVVNPRKKAACGIGAFNLVRAEAFHAIGGLSHLRLSIDDDVRLGQALKFAGYRCVLAVGQGAVAVRWHVGVWGMIRGLEKNFFAALDFKPRRVAVGLLGMIWVGVLPFTALVWGLPWDRAVCVTGIAALALIFSLERGLNGVAWYYALTIPFATLALCVALLRSTAVTLRQGGVRWRDSFYPLADLKAHTRERNTWLREVWKSTR